MVKYHQWIDIAERPRDAAPLMWITYAEAPYTVGEACELAYANKLIMMHRHEPNRVVAQIWVPHPRMKKGRKARN